MAAHAAPARQSLHVQAGATLVAVLILVAAASLLGMSALRTATTEAQLSNTLIAAQEAFWLAELGVAAGFNFALTRPAELPRDATIAIGTIVDGEHGRVETAIHAAGTDTHCPDLVSATAIRDHFEIHATGYAARGAISTHVQGFSICSEACATPGCEVAENPPVRRYWKAVAGGILP